MKRFKNTSKYIWIGLILMLFISNRSMAQVITTSGNILVGATADNSTSLTGTFATGSAPISFQFTLDVPVTGPWGISGCGASCPVTLVNASTGQALLTVPSSPREIEFDVNVNGGIAERHVKITIRNSID